jgi:hypothetical protein
LRLCHNAGNLKTLKRIIALRSPTEMPALDDPQADKKTFGWGKDLHEPYDIRRALDSTWDKETKTVTVNLDYGIRQLV